jgi:hypothetical protein
LKPDFPSFEPTFCNLSGLYVIWVGFYVILFTLSLISGALSVIVWGRLLLPIQANTNRLRNPIPSRAEPHFLAEYRCAKELFCSLSAQAVDHQNSKILSSTIIWSCACSI